MVGSEDETGCKCAVRKCGFAWTVPGRSGDSGHKGGWRSPALM